MYNLSFSRCHPIFAVKYFSNGRAMFGGKIYIIAISARGFALANIYFFYNVKVEYII